MNFKDFYKKDLAEKEVNVAYSRVMLLGSAGVGKTSFTRSLMKLDYRKDTDSTIVSDVHFIRPIYSNDTRDKYRPGDLTSITEYRPDDLTSTPEYRPDDPIPGYRPDDPTSTPEYRPDDPIPGYRPDDPNSTPEYRPDDPIPEYRPDDPTSTPEYRPDNPIPGYRPDDPISTPEYRPDDPNDFSSKTRRYYQDARSFEYNSASQNVYRNQYQLQQYVPPGQPVDYSGRRQPNEPYGRPHAQCMSSDRPVTYQRHMISNERWKVVNDDDEIDEVAHLLAAVYNKDYSASEVLRKTVAAMSLYKAESLVKPSDLSGEKIQRDDVESFLSIAMERAKKFTPDQIQDIKPQPFMHIWDCGGQAVFLEILPAFLTPRTMFFLLFNAAKNLNEKWENYRTTKGKVESEETASMSTKELLLNWMANIQHHLARQDEKGTFLSYPLIYCVGTHGDQLKNDDEQTAIISEMEREYLHKKQAFAHLVKSTLIVDNTTAGSCNEDPKFSIIRNEVHDFTCNNLMVKTPVSWVLFRKVIKMLDKKVISLKEAHKIGLACRIPHNDVPKVLLFYHDLGVILYYQSIKGLQDKVITNPQWFVDTLGNIFTLKGREVKDHKTRMMWDLLRNNGILVRPLYQEVWKHMTEIEPDDMMKLLVHFRLAAEVKTKQFYITEEKQYFLPAVLKSFNPSPQSSSFESSPVARATNLHITFSTDFVPPGFFTRLITSFAKFSTCEIWFEDGVYRDHITFMYGNPTINKVTLTDCRNTIKVSIERNSPSTIPFSSTCQQLKAILEDCGTEVDESLTNACNSSKAIRISRKFHYECTKCSSCEAHYIIPASIGQTADLHLCCRRVKTHRPPTLEESYWFPEGEQTAHNVR